MLNIFRKRKERSGGPAGQLAEPPFSPPFERRDPPVARPNAERPPRLPSPSDPEPARPSAPLSPGGAEPRPAEAPASGASASRVGRSLGDLVSRAVTAEAAPETVDDGFQAAVVPGRLNGSHLPRFRRALSEPSPGGAGRLDRSLSQSLWEAFTPTRPKQMGRLFAGRRQQLQRVISAIEEERANVVVFGERGLGKTSFANVISASAEESGYRVLRYACSSETTYDEMFRLLLRKIPGRCVRGAGIMEHRLDPAVDHCEQLLPAEGFGPTELTDVLRQITMDHVIFVIDEFDRVDDVHFRKGLAETIKNVSDVSARVTFFILGVAQSLEDLLGVHPSIQRNIIGVHLPLMTEQELDTVITMGEEASGLRFDEQMRPVIIRLSQGLPYFTQLLCFHSARHAIDRQSHFVERVDVAEAVERVVAEADHVLRAAYDRATLGERMPFMTDIVFAAASCRTDPHGAFTAEDVAAVEIDGEARRIAPLTAHKALSALSEDDKGALLIKHRTAAAETRYVFAYQAMRQYILARQARQRAII